VTEPTNEATDMVEGSGDTVDAIDEDQVADFEGPRRRARREREERRAAQERATAIEQASRGRSVGR
jgi:cell division protein FtsQ